MNMFEKICEFFNFNQISITVDDIEYLQKIAEDLKIDVISRKINQIYLNQEKILAKINDNQAFVESINGLFEWIYQINELSVTKVASLIIQSHWSKTEEDVQELAAFIIQTIETDQRLHTSLIDLLIQLDENGTEKLKILIPFLKEKIMKNISNNDKLCSFVYKSYSKGIISKEELFINFAKFKGKPINQSHMNDNSARGNTTWGNQNRSNPIKYNSLYVWFLPELIESGCINKNYLTTLMKSNHIFANDKIDLYKKMRDAGDPVDELTKALKKDNLDTVQSIISKMFVKDLSKCLINPDIFDPLYPNSLIYINYSAAYGSLKCFKYFLLNHSNIDSKTFHYSINGGNIEIIKIVDNYLQQNLIDLDNITVLVELIKNHKNTLFDWFFEYKITQENLLSENTLDKIINESASSGNVHALITLIDKGLIISDKKAEFFQLAARNGFYLLLQFLHNVLNRERFTMDENRLGCNDYVTFGNLSIFKFCISLIENDFSLLACAVGADQTKMINYFFDKSADKITINTISSVLRKALEKSNELFYYYIEKFKTVVPSIFEKFSYNIPLLEVTCKYNRIKPFYTIINSPAFEKNGDFTNCFGTAACSNSIEICKYLIEQKKSIRFEIIFQRITTLPLINRDIYLLIFNNNKFINYELIPVLKAAISSQNKNLVEILLEKNIFYEDCLIDSVVSNNIDIVNIILKCKIITSIIKRVSLDGTALHMAVMKNNLEIVKSLLSVPSINPNLIDKNAQTPLMIAVNQSYFPIIKELLSFVGKDIDVNFMSPKDGNTPLILALKNQRSDIAESLINDPRTDINLSNFNYESPLVVSVQTHQTSIVKLLINHEKINFKLSHADYAMCLSDDEILQLFLSLNSIDVNCSIIGTKKENYCSSNGYGYNRGNNRNGFNRNNQNNYNDQNAYRNFINSLSIPFNGKRETLLTRAARTQNLKIIELIIKKDKSNLSAVGDFFNSKDIKVNDQFFELLCSNGLINYFFQTSVNLNDLPVSFEKIEELFNNQSYAIPDENLVQLFTHSLQPIEKSINIMKLLFNYDKKHNNAIDFKKKQFLTKIKNFGRSSKVDLKRCLENIVDFILQNGGDVNQVDTNGYSPLQVAMIYNSIEFVQVLLNTKKVNFNQNLTIKRIRSTWDNSTRSLPISGYSTLGYSTWGYSTWGYFNLGNSNANNNDAIETYLHAAAMQKYDIFKLILDCSCIDINTKNSNNETPLMIACQYLKRKNIELLFKKDNLDFHCRNIFNKDALDCVNNSKIDGNGKNEKADEKVLNDALTKEQYFEKLMNKIAKKK